MPPADFHSPKSKPAGDTGGIPSRHDQAARVILASDATTVRNAVSCQCVSPSSKSPVIGPVVM
jgi:hypothetical protein